jgi:hypothetical protein
MLFLAIFSDDQTAILGCFAAIAVCGLIAALSFRFGPAGQEQQRRSVTLPLNSGHSADRQKSQERRAA